MSEASSEGADGVRGRSPRQVTVRVGIVQMPVDPWPVAAGRARELEAMGFAHLWVYDHLTWRHYRDRPWHATMPWLSGLATATDRIRLGTMVASPNLRHPLTLAKDAMSVDHLSGGRFILGVGAGTDGFDATVFGDDPLRPGARAGRFAEYVEVVDGLLTGELTDHDGTWYSMSEGRVLPGCVQRPRVPLAVAAAGVRSIGLAARRADTWITLGERGVALESVDDYEGALKRQLAVFDEACEQAGRDPAAVGKLAFVPGGFRAPVAGLEAFRDFAGRMGDLGFDEIVIHDSRRDDPELDFDPELIPAIAESLA